MLQSKLPTVKESIFTTMSNMAAQYNAINLSQGFPDFEVSLDLIDKVGYHMRNAKNQYAPSPGLPNLLESIAQKIKQWLNVDVDSANEITITSGATEANYCAISALVQNGDEVIILEPAYDSYAPVVHLNGGIVKFVKLNSNDFSIPWTEVELSITSKTKLLIINNPHNPTGAVLLENDLTKLSKLVERFNFYVLSDEVYEHILFEGISHQSVLKLEGIRRKAIATFSFGKTFHATGWKVGYSVAPAEITAEIRKIHQFLTFSVNTPIQWALTEFLNNPDNYSKVGEFYQKKRDLFLSLLQDSRFDPIPSYGTYFQMMKYKEISDLSDLEMAAWMTKKHGVASIPISAFYHDQTDHHTLRFCFAKNEDTLKKSCEILSRL